MPRTTGWDFNRNVSCVCSSLLAEFILVGEERNIALATKAVGFCRLYRRKKKKKKKKKSPLKDENNYAGMGRHE